MSSARPVAADHDFERRYLEHALLRCLAGLIQVVAV